MAKRSYWTFEKFLQIAQCSINITDGVPQCIFDAYWDSCKRFQYEQKIICEQFRMGLWFQNGFFNVLNLKWEYDTKDIIY